MKQHILAALKEHMGEWEELLSGLSEEQLGRPGPAGSLSLKDVLAHLWAWQQRSNARCAAARLDRDPEFPRWLAGLDPEAEESTEQINAWIYETYRDEPWQQVYQRWREGFLTLLDCATAITERDLLDGDRYAWLRGYPLALVLLGTYDHHQEHLEQARVWLREQGASPPPGEPSTTT